MNRHLKRHEKIKVEAQEEPVLLNLFFSALLGLTVALVCILAYEVGPYIR